MPTKIFSSSFDDAADGYQCAEGGNCLKIINQVTDAQVATYMYPSGSKWWIEGKDTVHRPAGAPSVPAHTGLYCLGLARQGSQRCEFQLREWGWDSYDIWYFDMWLYFPSNWDTTPTDTGWEVLFAFGDSVYAAPQGYPYIDIALWAWSAYPDGQYTLALEGRGFSNEGHTYDTKTYFALPRGAWSHWEIYFDRGDVDAGNGTVWVKVNGVEYLRSEGNVIAKDSANDGATLEIYPQDLYSGSGANEYRYLDDLEIWEGGVPTGAATKGFTVDMWTTGTRVKATTVDIYPKVVGVPAVTADMYPQSGAGVSTTVDMWLEAALAKLTTVDIYPEALQAKIAEVDMYPQLSPAKDITVDMWVQAQLAKGYSVDMIVDKIYSSLTVDLFPWLSTLTIEELGLLREVLKKMEKEKIGNYCFEAGCVEPGCDNLDTPMRRALRAMRRKQPYG